MNKINVTSRDEADRALQRIGQLQLKLEVLTAEAEVEIDQLRVELKSESEPYLAAIDANEEALKEWAKGDMKSWPAKSLELNFGSLGFRKGKAAIKLKLALENVVARLKACGLTHCVRTIEEVDKEQLANYGDEVLAKIGCARTKPKESFWCEPRREVVK